MFKKIIHDFLNLSKMDIIEKNNTYENTYCSPERNIHTYITSNAKYMDK